MSTRKRIPANLRQHPARKGENEDGNHRPAHISKHQPAPVRVGNVGSLLQRAWGGEFEYGIDSCPAAFGYTEFLLPEEVKQRLQLIGGKKITKKGDLFLKAYTFPGTQ